MTTSTTELFAITPVLDGRAAPADALVVGPMSEVMQYLPQSIARQDAVEELEKARFTADEIKSVQDKTRGVQAAILADSVNHLSSRLDAYVARRDVIKPSSKNPQIPPASQSRNPLRSHLMESDHAHE